MMAANAKPIVAARLNGMRPRDMVIVSLVGNVNSSNPTVYAKPEVEYDWRWVRDLDICLFVPIASTWVHIAKEIALQRPSHFNLWSSVEGWGAKVYLIPTATDVFKPVRLWSYELDFLPWMEFQNEEFKQCS